MIEGLPYYIPGVFIATTALVLAIWYWVMSTSVDLNVSGNSIKIILGVLFWLLIQAVLSIRGVYSLDTESLPPKIFIFGILPIVVIVCAVFLTHGGRQFIDSLSIVKLTYLNLVRIPVEFVLLWLYLQQLLPRILTFEGLNFDIVMGLTAPLIIYYGFVKQKLGRSVLLCWNVIGIAMLGFVFILAVLSSPFPLQQLAFDQPNVGLLVFPFSWLPTFIVPLVIVGHLICIRQLVSKNKK